MVPLAEKRNVLSISFSSIKFNGRRRREACSSAFLSVRVPA